MQRLIFSSVLFLTFFIFPWWIPAILSLAGIFIYVDFYEALAIGVMFFAVYFSGGLFLSAFYYSAFLIVLFIGLNYIKKFMIFYQK
ncbi:MAG: hypothetical protein NTX85_03805 [Candidatus Nomurabacteria bacterium]|nr:hypothetical protein [Candidatus Nomurabacteria bacterium]